MRTGTIIAVLLWLIVILACPVWAVTISGVSGTVSDGESITITGSGFGTGPTVLAWDRFEGGTNDATITLGGSIGAGPWSIYSSGDVGTVYRTPRYSNSTPRTGSSLFMRCHEENYGSYAWTNSWFAFSSGTPFSEYFVCFYYRWIHTSGDDLTGTNMKMHRISYANLGDIAGDVDAHFMTHTPADGWELGVKVSVSPGGQHSSMTGYGYGGLPAENQWCRIDNYGVYGSSSGTCDGTYRVYAQTSATSTFFYHTDIGFSDLDSPDHCTDYVGTEGALAHYVPDHHVWNQGNDSHPWGEARFGGYKGGYGIYEQDYDDVYVATSRARVELGNKATWANCTIREIQGTINSWADTSISIDVNQGAFEGGTAYLFVVDADGNVSDNDLETEGEQGYGVTIGGESTPPSTPSFTGVMTGSIR